MRPRLALSAGLLALVVNALTPVCAFGAIPATPTAAVPCPRCETPTSAPGALFTGDS
jgi:hypothetical protein